MPRPPGPPARPGRLSSTGGCCTTSCSGWAGGRPYGFVVGADGVHSTVREQVFGRAGMRSALLSRASWRFMAPNPGVDCFTVWSGAEGAFLMIPVDDAEVYVFASATRGGPVDSSRVLQYYIYDMAFGRFQFGYASAMSVGLLVVLVIITFLQYRLTRAESSDLA